MNYTTKFLVFATVLAIPFSAIAQVSDAEYCKRLGDVWRVYNRGSDPAANVATAMTKCHSAAAASIPVLEKALTDDKIKLPPKK
jgi:hypothetical protein